VATLAQIPKKIASQFTSVSASAWQYSENTYKLKGPLTLYGLQFQHSRLIFS